MSRTGPLGNQARINNLGVSQNNNDRLITENSQKLLNLIGILKASNVQDSDIVAVLVGNKSLESLKLDTWSINKLINPRESVFIETSGCFFSGHFIQPELGKILKNDKFKSTRFFGFGNSQDTKRKLARFEDFLKPSEYIFKEGQANIKAGNSGSDAKVPPPPPIRIKKILQGMVQAKLNQTLKNFNSKGLGSSLKKQYALDYERSDGVFLKIAGEPVLITDLIDKEGTVTPKFNELCKGKPEQAKLYQNILPILIRQDYRSIVMKSITTVCANKGRFTFPGIDDKYITEIAIRELGKTDENLKIEMKFNYKSQDEKGESRSLNVTTNLTMSTEFIKKSVDSGYTNSDFGVSEIKITEFDFKNPYVFSAYS